jgi:hypothetical protein
MLTDIGLACYVSICPSPALSLLARVLNSLQYLVVMQKTLQIKAIILENSIILKDRHRVFCTISITYFG